MKIVINIDVEQIVREEIRTYIKENIEINVAPSTVTPPNDAPQSTESKKEWVGYEYSPNSGKRRSRCDIIMHKEERRLNRTLLDHEKEIIRDSASSSPHTDQYTGADGLLYLNGKLYNSDIENELRGKTVILQTVDPVTEEEEVTEDEGEDEDEDDEVEEERMEGQEKVGEEETQSTPEPNEGVPTTETLDNLKSLFN